MRLQRSRTVTTSFNAAPTTMDEVGCEIKLLKPGTKHPPLICVHTGNFAAMAACMSIDRPIYGLTARDFERADPNLTIETVAVIYLAAVAKVQRTGPFLLFGYSFGGLIAYEMAGILVQRGEAIGLLALFDAPHPKFREQLTPAELEVVRKTYLADRKKKYLDNLREGRFNLLIGDASRFVSGKLKPVAWKAQKALRRALNLRRATVSESLRTEAMWHAYSPKPFPGKLVLFRAEGREAEFAEDPTMGWRKAVAGGVDVQFASGIHEEMMDMPHAQRLARQVSPYIDTAAVPRGG